MEHQGTVSDRGSNDFFVGMRVQHAFFGKHGTITAIDRKGLLHVVYTDYQPGGRYVERRGQWRPSSVIPTWITSFAFMVERGDWLIMNYGDEADKWTWKRVAIVGDEEEGSHLGRHLLFTFDDLTEWDIIADDRVYKLVTKKEQT